MAEVSKSYFGGSRSVNKRPDGADIARMDVSPKPPVDTRKLCVLQTPITRQGRERRTSFQPCPIRKKSSSQSLDLRLPGGDGHGGIAAHEEHRCLSGGSRSPGGQISGQTGQTPA